MAAMAACMSDPDMKEMYGRLRERGRHHKVAVTAVMRRLVVTANALLRVRSAAGAPPGERVRPDPETVAGMPAFSQACRRVAVIREICDRCIRDMQTLSLVWSMARL